MMINKRLIGTVRESKKYIAGNVALQWCALAANIAMIGVICRLLEQLYQGEAGAKDLLLTAAVAALAVIVRFCCNIGSARMGYLSSKAVKKTLREKIYAKLLRLGSAYSEQVQTSEVVQVAVEGVDQLETYFGAYLPQFFYAMLAPLTLFAVLCFVNVPSAVLLLVCVPLIPAAIAAVQTWAKKLLSKYWDQYTALGDTFLENLQGLTTLKIYQADEFKNQEMNEQSERFRRITMKVLSMQLNSITIMDLIAYGGAAAGMILAVSQFRTGRVGLGGCLAVVLLAADFFLPMRQLGSFFHIAMNGMAASDKIFKLLDLPEPEVRTKDVPEDCSIRCENLRFSYEPDREILKGVHLEFPQSSFTAIVGESGCGKSTVASILMGRNRGYLLSPSFDVVGIIASHFEQKAGYTGDTMEKSYQEVQKLLKLADIEDVPVFRGCTGPLASQADAPDSEGVDFLIREALRDDPRPLYIAVQGAMTNVAAALNREPSIGEHITVLWNGGGPYPAGRWEFNVAQDPTAVRALLASTAAVWQTPQNVYCTLEVTFAEIALKIASCGELGQYLLRQLEEECVREFDPNFMLRTGENWILGDNTTAAVLLQNRRRGNWHMRPSPILAEDLTYRENPDGKPIRVYDSIDVRMTLEDLFSKMQLAYSLS